VANTGKLRSIGQVPVFLITETIINNNRKIENNRIADLSDIRTDRETEFIGHLDFLSPKPTLFNNSAVCGLYE
jgi:hypothetical protein